MFRFSDQNDLHLHLYNQYYKVFLFILFNVRDTTSLDKNAHMN